MSETKWTPGPWRAFNMIHAETGERMTPDEVGEYVANCMRARPECDDFLFVSAEKPDGEYDVCHIGNGRDGAFNAALIAAAPELYEALENTNRELDAAIRKINELLESRITATDIDPPDYWDGQTLHENSLLLAKARGEQP